MLDTKETDQLILACGINSEALERLYRGYKNDVTALAFSIVKSIHQAEDVLQETFLRLQKLSRAYKPCEKGKVYILKIASNISHETLRKNKKYFLRDQSEEAYIPNDFVKADDAIMVNDLLQYLDEKEREIISLRFYNDLTFKEAAKVIQKSESAAKWRYESAMNKLRIHCFNEEESL